MDRVGEGKKRGQEKVKKEMRRYYRGNHGERDFDHSALSLAALALIRTQ